MDTVWRQNRACAEAMKYCVQPVRVCRFLCGTSGSAYREPVQCMCGDLWMPAESLYGGFSYLWGIYVDLVNACVDACGCLRGACGCLCGAS